MWCIPVRCSSVAVLLQGCDRLVHLAAGKAVDVPIHFGTKPANTPSKCEGGVSATLESSKGKQSFNLDGQPDSEAPLATLYAGVDYVFTVTCLDKTTKEIGKVVKTGTTPTSYPSGTAGLNMWVIGVSVVTDPPYLEVSIKTPASG